jgi:hypothetical protein
LFGPGPARLAEGGAEGFGIGHDGVAGKVQRLTGPLRRIGMAGTTGIFDHHRNDAEIGETRNDTSASSSRRILFSSRR